MFDATLTLNQLGHSMNRLHAMIGAKNFSQSQADQYVQFSFMRGAKNKATICRIEYRGDLYTMVFFKMVNKKVEGLPVRLPEAVEVDRIELLYSDDLARVFESKTGLNLSL